MIVAYPFLSPVRVIVDCRTIDMMMVMMIGMRIGNKSVWREDYRSNGENRIGSRERERERDRRTNKICMTFYAEFFAFCLPYTEYILYSAYSR